MIPKINKIENWLIWEIIGIIIAQRERIIIIVFRDPILSDINPQPQAPIPAEAITDKIIALMEVAETLNKALVKIEKLLVNVVMASLKRKKAIRKASTPGTRLIIFRALNWEISEFGGESLFS